MKPKRVNVATEMAIQELRESGEWGRLVETVKADVDVDKRSYVENAILEYLRDFKVTKFHEGMMRGKYKIDDVNVEHITLMIFNQGV